MDITSWYFCWCCPYNPKIKIRLKVTTWYTYEMCLNCNAILLLLFILVLVVFIWLSSVPIHSGIVLLFYEKLCNLIFDDFFYSQSTLHTYMFTRHTWVRWHWWHCYAIVMMLIRHSENLQVNDVNSQYMIHLMNTLEFIENTIISKINLIDNLH